MNLFYAEGGVDGRSASAAIADRVGWVDEWKPNTQHPIPPCITIQSLQSDLPFLTLGHMDPIALISGSATAVIS